MKKEDIQRLLLRCQSSPMFFIENFCKIKHPTAGIVPFNLFSYQKQSLNKFNKFRFNLYKKVRQCGISTLAGAYALWFILFHSHKTVLIVSKRDNDATGFLEKNVKFVYDHLPDLFKEIYGDPPKVYNEHTIVLPNGSRVQSLTSSKDTLRSNSSSLNILDEVGFMPHMDDMWAAGAPTLIHGGSVIAISTCSGQGTWYNVTWDDAVNGNNQFNPIEIQWWEMDWTIEYRDSITGKMCKISPRDGIRECTTKEEIDRWGKYWSPWLEDQYRQLQQKGEAHLFRQEILAEFIGSGDTVISRTALVHIKETIDHNFGIVEIVDNYNHPITSEKFTLNFENELRIWQKPVRATPPTIENGRIIKPGTSGHVYTMGVDIASGQAEDYSAIVIIDCNALEQVAELNMKISPTVLVMMVDYLARWYNTALVVPERTGIGEPVTQAIYEDIAYPNVYRMRINNKLAKRVGYPTTPAHKPALVKCLMDFLGEDGIIVKSSRLYQQLSIFINLGKNKVGNVKGPGNHDDLVIALALALIGLRDAVQSDHRMLIPSRFSPTDETQMPIINNEVMSQGGIRAVPPIIMSSDLINTALSPEQEIANFTRSLGATINHPGNVPAVIHRKRMGPDGRIIG